MGVILDSDVLSILQQPACSQLEKRLDQLADDEVATTIVSFQEQMQGWVAAVHKARSEKRLLLAYSELQLMQRDFCHLTLLPYDSAAQKVFARLQRQKVRIGTMDLRIASITLATQSTLISRNLRDFFAYQVSMSKTGRSDSKSSLARKVRVSPLQASCATALTQQFALLSDRNESIISPQSAGRRNHPGSQY